MVNRPDVLEPITGRRNNSESSTNTLTPLAAARELTLAWTSSPQKDQPLKSRQFVVIYAMLGMLAWLYLFGIGMLVDSKPFRELLAKTLDLQILVGAILTFTPTNVALLAMLAGFLGGCASLLMYSDYDAINPSKSNRKAAIDEDRLAYLQENPLSSALRGFLVYLTFLAGTIFSSGGVFASTTQDQYCRLAGAVAVLAFSVGYDPTVFRSVLSMVTRGASARTTSNQTKPESDRPSASAPTR